MRGSAQGGSLLLRCVALFVQSLEFLVEEVRHENPDNDDGGYDTQIFQRPAGDAVEHIGNNKQFKRKQYWPSEANTDIVGYLL